MDLQPNLEMYKMVEVKNYIIEINPNIMAYIMVSPRTYHMGDALIPFDKLTHVATATTIHFDNRFHIL